MKRIAVCVGVDQYDDAKVPGLKFAGQDAEQMAFALKGLGFEPELLNRRSKTTAATIYRSLSLAATKLAEAGGGQLAFFFAGHGKAIKRGRGNELYLLLPDVDLELLDPEDMGGVPGVLSVDKLISSTARHAAIQRLFIFDACRVPLSSGTRDLGDAGVSFRLALAAAPEARVDSPLTVLYGCTEGTAAAEIAELGHGLCTHSLLESFKTVQGGELVLDGRFERQLAERMAAVGLRHQLRQSQSPKLDGAPFELVPAQAAAPLVQAPPQAPTQRDAEERLWDVAEALDSVDGYLEYLRTSDLGRHIPEAKARIQALRNQGTAAAEAAIREAEAKAAEEAAKRAAEQKAAEEAESKRKADELAAAEAKRKAEAKAAADPIKANQSRSAGAIGVGREFRDCLKSGGEGPLLVVVPQGRFWQGSPADEPERSRYEGPQRLVTIGYSLAVAKYPVTFAEYDRAVAAGACERPKDEWGRGQMPVINVSWHDAQQYIDWLNRETGLDTGPEAYRYRLLSESEWEYAARGEQNGPQASTPFARLKRADGGWTDGRTLDTDLVNYDGNFDYPGCPKTGINRGQTWEVGSSGAVNAFGLSDMHGNVWEWVQDSWHFSYQQAPEDGSAWVTGAGVFTKMLKSRVLRGGSWNIISRDVRSACRFNHSATIRYNVIGFRLTRTLPP